MKPGALAPEGRFSIRAQDSCNQLYHPESEVRIIMIGHPERSLPRFVRQTESKDLHLFFNELQAHHTGD
jgi:hypothetical protein